MKRDHLNSQKIVAFLLVFLLFFSALPISFAEEHFAEGQTEEKTLETVTPQNTPSGDEEPLKIETDEPPSENISDEVEEDEHAQGETTTEIPPDVPDAEESDFPENNESDNEETAPAISPSPTSFEEEEALKPLSPSIFTVRYYAQDTSGQRYELTDYIQYVQANQPTTSPGTAPTIPQGESVLDYWALEGTETPFDFASPITQDRSLVAVYRSEWLVHFFDASTLEGGSGKILKTLHVVNGNKIDASEAPAISIIPDKTLSGWALEGQSTPFDFANQIITEDINLFPVLIDQLSVFFVTNGSLVEPQLVTAGNSIAQPTDPTRAGYVFSHWSTAQDGEAFDFATPITQNTILYAVWTAENVDFTLLY